MTTRVKVVCSSKQVQGDYTNVQFNPVYTGSKENELFFKYTPGGNFQFFSVRDSAAQFEMGKEYYFDIFVAE